MVTYYSAGVRIGTVLETSLPLMWIMKLICSAEIMDHRSNHLIRSYSVTGACTCNNTMKSHCMTKKEHINNQLMQMCVHQLYTVTRRVRSLKRRTQKQYDVGFLIDRGFFLTVFRQNVNLVLYFHRSCTPVLLLCVFLFLIKSQR